MATIGDVAEYAGVSRSTVSHALSGKRPISRETRDRISVAIAALNYTANAGARALATSKTSIMGLIVPFRPEEFAPATMQYVLSVTETARKLAYDVLLVTGEEGAEGITRVTDSNLVDGVILMDIKRHDERIATLEDAEQPGVLLGIPEGDATIDCLDLDFAEAARMLTAHLHELGHREVLFVTLPEQLFAQDLAYAWGFRDAAIANARRLDMTLTMVTGDIDPVLRAAAIGRAIDEHPECTALLVHNDGALVDLPHLLHERALSVPADLSVVSIFPEQFGRMFSLPYTAIETSAATVAERAVQLLAARIADADHDVVRELIAPMIIDRGSSRAL